jgi:hypothetical protein
MATIHTAFASSTKSKICGMKSSSEWSLSWFLWTYTSSACISQCHHGKDKKRYLPAGNLIKRGICDPFNIFLTLRGARCFVENSACKHTPHKGESSEGDNMRRNNCNLPIVFLGKLMLFPLRSLPRKNADSFSIAI